MCYNYKVGEFKISSLSRRTLFPRKVHALHLSQFYEEIVFPRKSHVIYIDLRQNHFGVILRGNNADFIFPRKFLVKLM